MNAGSPYIVGEDGRELFIPGKSGTIVSNKDFEDAAAAMSSPGTSTAFADAGEAMEMATATTMANLTTRQEQQALAQASANASSSTSRIALDTTVINSVEYATMDQVVKVGQQSAQQAKASVFKDLKNMPASRGRAGVR